MTRITSRMLIERSLRDVSAVQDRLAALQAQLASGKRIARPSDDPSGMTRALAIRTNVALTEQYTRNIDSGLARLSATEASLASFTQLIQRARELTVMAANSSLDQSQRSQIALEVRGELDEAIAIGNTQFAGQYLFAGHKSTTAPFTPVGTPPTSVTYNGDSGAVLRDISVGVQVTVNAPGDTTLGPAYSALIQLRDDLETGNIAALQTTDLTALDGVLDGLLRTRGLLGATTNRLDMTRGRLDEGLLAERTQLSELEDADFVSTVVNLNSQQAALQAALEATARGIQTSLLDFLR